MHFTSSIIRLPNYILSLDLSLQQLWYYFPNCVYSNPPCQLSLWEETGAPGENSRLSTERWLTLFTSVRNENQTHELRGERRALPKPTTDLCSFMYTVFTNYLPSLGREGLNEMYDDVRKQLELEKKLRKVRGN
jgi:hypothetical protein